MAPDLIEQDFHAEAANEKWVSDLTYVWTDEGWLYLAVVLAEVAPRAKDFTQAKGSRNRQLTEQNRARNRNKSRVRAKVEHQFGIIKWQFGFNKVRYRGLDKNAHWLFVTCALSNLAMAKKTLLKRKPPPLQVNYACKAGFGS